MDKNNRRDKMTAKECLEKTWIKVHKEYPDSLWNLSAKTAMIEFAKLHVEAALKAASEKAEIKYIEPDGCATGDYYDIDKDSILNSYPLENIN